MLRMELPGKIKRGEPRRSIDMVREDMAEDRTKRRWNIRCGDSWWDMPEEKKNDSIFIVQQLCKNEMGIAYQ